MRRITFMEIIVSLFVFVIIYHIITLATDSWKLRHINNQRTIIIRDGVPDVVLFSGEILTIKLVGRSTGHTWNLFNHKDNILQPDKDKLAECIPGDNADNVGGPYYEVFRFTALKPGHTLVHFTYRRSWEKDVPPLQEYVLEVTVQ